MNLTCYRVHDDAPELIPARSGRAWMDTTASRLPFGATPFSMANATGWELICPCGITATWNGGAKPGDLVVALDEPGGKLPHFAQSLHGRGVLTFHPVYLFTPGMTVTAEVRTDTRRVIDYLFSPLAKIASEALREK